MLNHWKLVSVLLCIFFKIPTHICKDNGNCFRTATLSATSVDCPPRYLMRLNITPDGVVHAVTTVNVEIPTPIVKMSLIQRDANGDKVVLFNVTAKLCDFLKFVNQIQMFRDIARNSLRSGNYSMSCPMRKGVYVLDNVRIGARNPLLHFVYKPKRTLTFVGGVSTELSNKTLLQLSRYEIVLRIVKKAC